jgi:hypothetical protein
MEKIKTKAATPGSAASSNLSPLDFLLGVMRSPNVAPDLRIKVAATVGPFVHPKPRGAAPIVADGPYGFDIDPEVARAVWENMDRSRLSASDPIEYPRVGDSALEPHIAERLAAAKCPDGYAAKEAREDRNRLVRLCEGRKALTEDENAEAADLAARLEVYARGPEGKDRLRLMELRYHEICRPFSAEEQSEIARLKAIHPDLEHKPDPWQVEAALRLDRVIAERAEEASRSKESQMRRDTPAP